MNLNKHLTLLVLCDISVAFGTVDHIILLNGLNSNFGISGHVLSWFHFYVHNRLQSVSLNGETSLSFDVKHGVPQGSCLGPLLFILYFSKLFTIVECHLPEVHAMPMTHNFISPSNLSLNMPLMPSQLCKHASLIYRSRC